MFKRARAPIGKTSGEMLRKAFLWFYTNPVIVRAIVKHFHRLVYYTPVPDRTWVKAAWLGAPVRKCPTDLWVYQETIHELRPDWIIECGTGHGGSALFLASICDLMENGKVITIDVEAKENRPKHPRIRYLLGSSTSAEIVRKVRRSIASSDRILVILDSDHSKEHVLDELKIYGEIVSRNSYLIVEDTNLNGHPVSPFHGPGPFEAVAEFLEDNDEFEVDKDKEKFFLTFNPRGYLRKK